MTKRQICACLLATACAASMSVTAFAAAEEVTMADVTVATDQTDVGALGDWNLDVDTEVQKPTLKVTLPSSTSVLVNPYRIEIKTGTDTTSFDTVLSPEMEIINKSGCAIKVSVKGSVQAYTLPKKSVLGADGKVDPDQITDGIGEIDSNFTLDLAKAPDGVEKVYALDGSLSEWDSSLSNGNGAVKAGKNPTMIVDQNGRQLTATFTQPTFATTGDNKGTQTANPKVVVTAYTASKDVKVATAPFVADTDKSNSLFIYAEGRQADGDWASAYKLTAAGTKDTKTGAITSTTGMVALGAKETTGAILYLGADATGYARITGLSSTTPTKSWTTVIAESPIETPIAFVIDAVANEAPAGPQLTKITFKNAVKPASDASAGDQLPIQAGKTTYTGLTWNCDDANSSEIQAVLAADPAAKTTSYTSSNTAVITIDTSTPGKIILKPLSNGKAIITATYTASNGGKSVYTFEITVSNYSA